MEIPNLSQNQEKVINNNPKKKKNIIIIILIVILAITSGFWASRFWPSKTSVSLEDESVVGADSISPNDLQVGVLYGDLHKTFKDTATGTIEKGNINGEGTHILNREGGESQRVSLISSTVDLDLFIDKKVEVTGETNASNKTSWLLDVGNIKIIE